MKKGFFNITMDKEDGSQTYLYQDSSDNVFSHNTKEFNLYNRRSEQHGWERVYREDRTPHVIWGQPIVSSRISAEVQSTYTREYQLNVGTDGLYTFDTSIGMIRPTRSEQPTGISSASAIRAMEILEHERHVEEHREIARMARREIQRREEQRQAELLRQEEERNRPRRPWERVRDMFR